MTSFRFSKWEGLGNDFIVLDARQERPQDPGELATVICDRHFGAGADGFVMLVEGDDADLGMEIFNSDGSGASMCGNALRCLAAMAHREGLVHAESGRISFSTGSGRRVTRLLGVSPWWVEVEMGQPHGWGAEAAEKKPCFETTVSVDGRELKAYLVSMGNPHCVIPVERIDAERWQDWGRKLECADFAGPGRTNVEFVVVEDSGNLTVKVWERGAGPTLACGTGACAALVAMAHIGRCHRTATVNLPGGALEVEWTRRGEVLMRGPARELFRGEWRPDPN